MKRTLWVRDHDGGQTGLVDVSRDAVYRSTACEQIGTAPDELPIVQHCGGIVYDEGDTAISPWRHGEPCYLDDPSEWELAEGGAMMTIKIDRGGPR